MKHITLAYCEDNRTTADGIIQQLSPVDLQFERISCHNATGDGLGEMLKSRKGFVLLLISDNFLKSTKCMYKALLALQNLNSAGQLQAVIIDGQHTDLLTKKVTTVNTSFERVSSVIQYMNFWQEQYLEMRKQKSSLKEKDVPAFNDRLKIIRSISTEIGEFLRYLRGVNYLTYDQLSHNHFEIFFDRTDNLGLYHDYKSKAIPKVMVHEAVDNVASNGNSSGHTDIPGMDLLSKAEPIINELNNESEISQLEENPQKEIVEESEEIEEEVEELNLDIEDISDEVEIGPDASSDNHAEMVSEVVDTPIEANVESSEENSEENKEDSYDLLQSLFDEDEEDEDEVEMDVEEEIGEAPPLPVTTESAADVVKQALEEAEKYNQAGEVKMGLELLKNTLDQHPENVPLRYQYAQTLLEDDPQSQIAQEQLETLITHDNGHINAYFRLAELAQHQQNFKLAHSYYEKVYDLNDEIPGLAYKLGLLTSHFYKDDAEKAARYLKRAIKDDSEHSDARYAYAVLLYERLDKPEKAIKQLEKTLKLAPDHSFANYDLALIFHGEGKLKEAAEYYQQAYLINPELKTDENDEAFHYEAEEEVISAAPLTTAPPEAKAETTKIVLITGATAGIGRATAEEFAKNGYHLILTGRRQEKLEALQLAFKTRYNTESECLVFDVRNLEAAKEALNSLPEAFKQVDILINNAGLAKGYAPIHEGNLDHWETMIDTNIKGLLYITRAISPFMVERKKGHIINVCSSAGHEVYPNGNVYCATKFAVDALTKSIRLDLLQHNIRVSQVSPGHVEETEFARVRFDGNTERAKIYDDFNPLKSKDVAEVIYFIATRPAYVNIGDVQMTGTQQAGNNHINRSGRIFDEE